MKVNLFFRHYKKIILWIGVICLVGTLSLLAFIAYKYFRGETEEGMIQSEKIVEVEVVKRANINQTVELIGTIQANKKTILTSKSKGILEVFIQSGQPVKKGELLAKIKNNEIEQNVHIQKELEEIAQKQFDRSVFLLTSGLSSKQNMEEKKTLLLDLQKKHSDAKSALEELKIYAPFDGMAGVFKLRSGSEASPGEAIVTFYDPSLLLVEFDLPLFAAKQVSDGADIFVNQNAYRLTHVQKMLDEETHMCPAYAEINCPDCIIGTAVDISVVLIKKENVLVIPLEAVFIRETKSFVYKITDNKAILSKVELGVRNKNQVEIKSGLKSGDKIVVYGHNRLYPDALVKVSK